MSNGFFDLDTGPDGEVLHPTAPAFSSWGTGGQLRGMAVSGALARAAERAVHELDGTDTLRPVRWTLDLLRPARDVPYTAVAAVVRRGRRLCLVDAALRHADEIVARGSALFLAGGGRSRGTAWSPADTSHAPPPTLHPAGPEPRVYYSDGVGWTASPEPHQNAARKMTWHRPTLVVTGERPTPFQQAAMVADVVNVVSNWGDAGLEFINADVTLAIARLPAADQEMGLAAESRIEDDGIAVGTATMFDRAGAFGTATVSGLLNGSSVVDPRRFGVDAAPGNSHGTPDAPARGN